MIEIYQNSLFENCLRSFSRSSLEESKAMSFLNRFDTKYVLKVDNAFDFLRGIQDSYSLLQINDKIIQSYKTFYFDTPDLHCYNLHHNKRANRFKFRTRQYLSNGKIYNEIKQKLNTGKTIKFRQRRDGMPDISEFDGDFANLLHTNNYNFEKLIPSLFVSFNRITLLNKYFPERMTLDFGLEYSYNNEEFTLNNTVIIELKRERTPEITASQEFFRKMAKTPSSFSKYAIGITLTHEEAKKNRFLPKVRHLPYEHRSLV